MWLYRQTYLYNLIYTTLATTNHVLSMQQIQRMYILDTSSGSEVSAKTLNFFPKLPFSISLLLTYNKQSHAEHIKLTKKNVKLRAPRTVKDTYLIYQKNSNPDEILQRRTLRTVKRTEPKKRPKKRKLPIHLI